MANFVVAKGQTLSKQCSHLVTLDSRYRKLFIFVTYFLPTKINCTIFERFAVVDFLFVFGLINESRPLNFGQRHFKPVWRDLSPLNRENWNILKWCTNKFIQKTWSWSVKIMNDFSQFWTLNGKFYLKAVIKTFFPKMGYWLSIFLYFQLRCLIIRIVIQNLNRTGFEPGRLVLEVTTALTIVAQLLPAVW